VIEKKRELVREDNMGYTTLRIGTNEGEIITDKEGQPRGNKGRERITRGRGANYKRGGSGLSSQKLLKRRGESRSRGERDTAKS